jgi:TATA-binding protein-associated factor
VRETAAQALGAAVQPLSIESLRVLLGLLQTLASCEQWEVRHSGLLALKYVIAAQPDSAAQLLPLAVNIATAGLKVGHVPQAAVPPHLASFQSRRTL